MLHQHAEEPPHAAFAESASEADSTQTNTSKEDVCDGAATAGEAAEPVGLPHAPQLSLHEARQLLDKDHYGLDKVRTMRLLMSSGVPGASAVFAVNVLPDLPDSANVHHRGTTA